MTDVPSLARTAHETQAVVIGGGLAGLIAAHSFAEVGMAVTLVESQDALGGSLRTATLAGRPVDLGPTAFPARTDFMDILRSLELGDGTIAQATAARTTVIDGKIRPMPAGVVGIPANPFDPQVVSIIGWGGAWRAYLDRLRPVLTIGNAPLLGPLVRSRMGRKVAERLVGPVARSAFGSGVDDLTVDGVAPKLNAALTRAGNLSGGVAELLEDDGPALRLMRDGFVSLTDALERRLRDLGVTILTGTDATRVARAESGFVVTTAARPTTADPAAPDTEAKPTASDVTGAVGEDHTIPADLLFVATDEDAARALLAQAGAEIPGDALTRPAVTVALAVDAAGLPDIGAGVYTQLDEPAVWAVDDLSAQRGDTGDVRTLRVRLSPVAADRTDDEAIDIAVSEASRLLGTPLRPREAVVARASAAASGARSGASARRDEARAAIAAVSGLAAAGGWLSGSGVVPVAVDAAEIAEALRRTALFG